MHKLEKEAKEFICSLCDKKLRSKYTLKLHTINCHTNGDNEQPNLDAFLEDEKYGHSSVSSGIDSEYNCPCCSYVAQSELQLDNHLSLRCLNYTKYVEYLQKCSSQKSKFNCYSCGYKSKSKISYKKHMKKHGYFKEIQVFSCPECNYTTSRRSLISSHILTHTKVKKYKCDHCDYSAIRSDYLKKHLVTHKKDHRPYKCNFCGYTTIRNDHLKKHSLKHSQYPPLKCADCDYRCSQRAELQSHMNMHQHATLFKCTSCDFESQEKDVMKVHVTTHSEFSAFLCHNSSTADCDKCKMRFDNNDDMIDHRCAVESEMFSPDDCNIETNDKIIAHTAPHCSGEQSNNRVSEYEGGILIHESENSEMMSDYTIVQLPQNITFLTDGKITVDDLVLTAFPIEQLAISKEDSISEISPDPSLIVDIEY